MEWKHTGEEYMSQRLKCTVEEKIEAFGTVSKIFQYARIARSEGVLGLEEPLQAEKDQFLREGLSLVMDGVEPEELKEYLISYISIADLSGRRFLEMMMIADSVVKIQANVNPKHVVLRFAGWFGNDFRESFHSLLEDMDKEEWQRARKRMYCKTENPPRNLYRRTASLF